MATAKKVAKAAPSSLVARKAAPRRQRAASTIFKKAVPAVRAVKAAVPTGSAHAKAAPKKKLSAVSGAKLTVSRASDSKLDSVTIKKISRNIIGFYMTEDLEVTRATQSDNMSIDKLKAKYAQLKAKAKSR